MDDRELAIALQKEYDREAAALDDEWLKYDRKSDFSGSSGGVRGITTPKSLIDPAWELLDPNPDIRSLFQEFNATYFWSKLSMVEVRWSPRMTLCAGLCCYEGRGGLCSIRLSQPLLRLRPRKDLIETLLHEMIHALLFVTDNNKDHDGHGPEFCKHMQRINAAGGCNITIYHNFHDEVDHLRQHWWRCQGTCRTKPPYFGYVRRAMNRAPSARDPWWPQHQRTCGGTYIKVKEPEDYGKKKGRQKDTKPLADKGTNDILPYLSQNKTTGLGGSKPSSSQEVLNPKSSDESPGCCLGGFHAERSNQRGIPLTSKLLSSVETKLSLPNVSRQPIKRNSTRTVEKKSMENKWTELTASKKRAIDARVPKQKNVRGAITIPEFVERMKRKGQKSVNAGAEAFKSTAPITTFGRNLHFQDSEDESSSEKENRNTESQKHFPNKVSNKNSSWKPKPFRSSLPLLDSDDDGDDMKDFPERRHNTNCNSTSVVSGCDSLQGASTVKNDTSFEVDFNKNKSTITGRGTTKRLPSLSEDDESVTLTEMWQTNSSKKLKLDDVSVNEQQDNQSRTNDDVLCPICNKAFALKLINHHIDDCLSVQAIRDSSFN